MSLTKIQDINILIILSVSDDVLLNLDKVIEFSDLFWNLRFELKYGKVLNNIDYIYRYRSIYMELLHRDERETIREITKRGFLHLIKSFVNNNKLIFDYLYIILNVASAYNQINIIKYIVDLGVNIKYNDNVALRCAIIYGNIEIVDYLVHNGADIKSIEKSDILRILTDLNRVEMIKHLFNNYKNLTFY